VTDGSVEDQKVRCRTVSLTLRSTLTIKLTLLVSLDHNTSTNDVQLNYAVINLC